ncbi:hypothetical protein MAH1_35230 [Sessilibacter sp. MAH1]
MKSNQLLDKHYSYEDLKNILEQDDPIVLKYLQDHYWRFVKTLNEFKSTWPSDGGRVLDVGAHWLHQSVIWKQAGFDITAIELSSVFSNSNIQNISKMLNIKLIPCSNLEDALELKSIPDNSMDIILFTEILEHITFNPIKFWKEIYRILNPGGKILITTPNYYSWKGKSWQFLRFITGNGGGITVDNVLSTNTYGHHWKEYSRKEIIKYFQLLSPDFISTKFRLMPTYNYSKVKWKNKVQSLLDLIPLLRPNLHIEICLPSKSKGITLTPSW